MAQKVKKICLTPVPVGYVSAAWRRLLISGDSGYMAVNRYSAVDERGLEVSGQEVGPARGPHQAIIAKHPFGLALEEIEKLVFGAIEESIPFLVEIV